MISTTRNALVWDTEPNTALMVWGKKKVNKIARAWIEKRSSDNEQKLLQNVSYIKFREQAKEIGNKRALKIADKLVSQAIKKNPIAETEDHEPLIQVCLDFLEFDAFWEITEDLTETEFDDTEKLLTLFREWQIVESKEMARVTRGRIETIEKFQNLIEKNALEVPTLHNFIKEFPWVIDPRWTLVDDEVRYSDLLRDRFPESDDIPDTDRRIDFLCAREGKHLVVVEIKRPQSKIRMRELEQIESYVNFIQAQILGTSDPDLQSIDVSGYLLCGDVDNDNEVQAKKARLAQTKIYVRLYTDLLDMVKRSHSEFLKRYNELREAKRRTENLSDS